MNSQAHKDAAHDAWTRSKMASKRNDWQAFQAASREFAQHTIAAEKAEYREHCAHFPVELVGD